MRTQLLRIWVVVCVLVVIGGAAWWLRDVIGADEPEAEIVLLDEHTGPAADGGTVRITVGVLATTPASILERPDLGGLEIRTAVASTPRTVLRTPQGQDELRGRLLVALRSAYPDAGIERVLVTDLFIGS
jgi:hypothetical protein